MAPRVALVHDFLLDLRGAERVFAAICDAWPEADVFTAVYDQQGTEGRFAARAPRTSFLQHVRPTARTFRPLLPLYPRAIESLDLRGYELVVSSSSAWAHGVIADPVAVHVCYCHNPFRYAWTEMDATVAARPWPLRAPLATVLTRWRQWDRAAARRVDRYVANSTLTASRVRDYFGREAHVLHPPVELNRFRPGEVGDHYLVVAELMAHKRIDVAVEAFNRLRMPLTVVGDGPAGRHLRRLAGPTVTFTGRLADREVADLMRSARALVVTAAEEFGIAAVEALASGRPVIALASGGVQEVVRPGRTGVFFPRSNADSLAEAVTAFDPLAVDPRTCVSAAGRFAVPRFQHTFRGLVGDALAARNGVAAAEPLPRAAAG
ncbi:MAG TPA: glycosyltransferase [Solirubrobacteraceae bacterium]|jgi:glycosyltransferase involved in cell wall biosynthesis|nr:glycosyltransferase [Solirubrobacteraceae bacterium]